MTKMTDEAGRTDKGHENFNLAGYESSIGYTNNAKNPRFKYRTCTFVQKVVQFPAFALCTYAVSTLS